MQIDLANWLRLEQTTGIGPGIGRLMLSAFGLPINIFASSLAALQSMVLNNIALALVATSIGFDYKTP
ncbi:MAG: hypothetical protein H7240_02005 [Glaciimonas sp.]|nr:hypothetical protein [Glaciimonas sp.]